MRTRKTLTPAQKALKEIYKDSVGQCVLESYDRATTVATWDDEAEFLQELAEATAAAAAEAGIDDLETA